MKISIGSDHAGLELKEQLKVFLKKQGYDVDDIGTYSKDRVDYPVFSSAVASRVSNGQADKGIVICATGIGVSIVANKIQGIRAALCTNVETAKLTREHNDSNILALGQSNVDEILAKEIVVTWLETPFSEENRHKKRINQIALMEQ